MPQNYYPLSGRNHSYSYEVIMEGVKIYSGHSMNEAENIYIENRCKTSNIRLNQIKTQIKREWISTESMSKADRDHENI